MLSRFFLQTITPLYSIEPETFQKVVWDVPIPRTFPVRDTRPSSALVLIQILILIQILTRSANPLISSSRQRSPRPESPSPFPDPFARSGNRPVLYRVFPRSPQPVCRRIWIVPASGSAPCFAS